jgi:hypothetical protein
MTRTLPYTAKYNSSLIVTGLYKYSTQYLIIGRQQGARNRVGWRDSVSGLGEEDDGVAADDNIDVASGAKPHAVFQPDPELLARPWLG